MAEKYRGSKDALSKIPNLLDAQDEVFSSSDEMRLCLSYLNRVFSSDWPLSDPAPSVGYLINSVQVEFVSSITEERVSIDHAKGRLLIQLPSAAEEMNTKDERLRRENILLRYAAIAEELRMRALIQAYRALNKTARKKLLLAAKKYLNPPMSKGS